MQLRLWVRLPLYAVSAVRVSSCKSVDEHVPLLLTSVWGNDVHRVPGRMDIALLRVPLTHDVFRAVVREELSRLGDGVPLARLGGAGGDAGALRLWVVYREAIGHVQIVLIHDTF